MLLQSLFFAIFAFVLAAFFSIGAIGAVHRLEVSQLQMRMLRAADHADELARASAAATIQEVTDQADTLPLLTPPDDTIDASGTIRIHTTIDAAPDANTTTSPCNVHDASHACNLSVGNALAEERVWETIDLRTSGGPVAVTLRRHVLLRLLRNRPYATIAAVRDDGTLGSQFLGDPAGVPAAATDAVAPQSANPQSYHDTRVHVYEPCRFVDPADVAAASDGHAWPNWEGTQASPARQDPCNAGAGETTQYVSTVQTTPDRNASAWGH